MTNSPAQISRVAAAQTGKVQPGRGKPFMRKCDLMSLAKDAMVLGLGFSITRDGTLVVAPARKEQPDDLDNVRMR